MGITKTGTRSSSIRKCCTRPTRCSIASCSAPSRSTCSTTRLTNHSCCGSIASCPIGPISRAGRSAPASMLIRIWRRSGSTNEPRRGRTTMTTALRFLTIGAALFVIAAVPGLAAETPKSGGTLTFLIPADAPPTFDGHREGTFATLHAVAPFYSVLVRVNPDNPSSTTDFVCDLCTVMPQATDGGKAYTFKLRDGVKFHDGSPLSAADVAASWEHIIHPPKGVLSPRQSWYEMVDKIETPDQSTVIFN